MLEPKTLKETPVPDPGQVGPAGTRRLISLVDRRLTMAKGGQSTLEIERAIDDLVADFYELSSRERVALGMAD